jgi:nicotinamidase-related amidase
MMKYPFMIFFALICLFPAVSHAGKIINGIPVSTTLEDFAVPQSCAIIVVDMQNGWVSTEGMCNRADRKMGDPARHQPTPLYKEQVPRMRRLIQAARQAKVPVVIVEFIHENAQGHTMMMGPDLYIHRNAPWLQNIVEGTWDSRTVDELAPQPGDLVIRKHHGNSFYDTPLADQLKNMGVKSVLITGTATAGCVHATGIGAQERGFYPVFVEDCIDHQFEPALQLIKAQYPVYSSEEIIKIWANSAKPAKKQEKKKGNKND